MPAPVPEPKRKRPANLSLSPERLRFGQNYAQENQTSLSRVVEDLLIALEQTLAAGTRNPPVEDPLDGLLVGWPQTDKKALRMERHEARLAR